MVGAFPFTLGTLSSTNVVLISLLLAWNLSVLRLNHQKASLFLFSFGAVHPVTLLDWIFNKVEKVLSFLDKEGKEIILLGDTTCDLTPKQAEQPIDNNSKHMLDLYELFSFKQLLLIDQPGSL